MNRSLPGILPPPQQMAAAVGCFRLDARTRILILPESSPEAFAAASSLRAEIKTVTGLRLQILRTARPPRRENIILLCDDPREAGRYLGLPFPSEESATHGEQAYSIAISAERVLATLRASSRCTMPQTLRQIVRLQRVGPRARSMTGPCLPTGA